MIQAFTKMYSALGPGIHRTRASPSGTCRWGEDRWQELTVGAWWGQGGSGTSTGEGRPAIWKKWPPTPRWAALIKWAHPLQTKLKCGGHCQLQSIRATAEVWKCLQVAASKAHSDKTRKAEGSEVKGHLHSTGRSWGQGGRKGAAAGTGARGRFWWRHHRTTRQTHCTHFPSPLPA